MWKGKGRSGIGDTSIQGTWEDWDGLSPNGRQYKNAITQETRNLSGADYWHARKADYPKQEPEVWVNGKANIAAFREEDKPKAKKKTDIRFDILPQQKTLNRLDHQEKELREAFNKGEVETEEFYQLLQVLDDKRERAIRSLNKALKIEDEDEAIPSYALEEENDFSPVFPIQKALFSLTKRFASSNVEQKKSKTGWEDVKSGSEGLNFLTGVLVIATLLIVISNF